MRTYELVKDPDSCFLEMLRQVHSRTSQALGRTVPPRPAAPARSQAVQPSTDQLQDVAAVHHKGVPHQEADERRTVAHDLAHRHHAVVLLGPERTPPPTPASCTHH